MSTKDTGGTAFPSTQYAAGVSPSGHSDGITLRDYFAAKAMHGLIVEPVSGNQSCTQYLTEAEPGDAENKGARLARAAYVMADAMLRARNGGQA